MHLRLCLFMIPQPAQASAHSQRSPPRGHAQGVESGVTCAELQGMARAQGRAGQDDARALPGRVLGQLAPHEEAQVLVETAHERGAGRDAIGVKRLARRRHVLALAQRLRARLAGAPPRTLCQQCLFTVVALQRSRRAPSHTLPARPIVPLSQDRQALEGRNSQSADSQEQRADLKSCHCMLSTTNAPMCPHACMQKHTHMSVPHATHGGRAPGAAPPQPPART